MYVVPSPEWRTFLIVRKGEICWVLVSIYEKLKAQLVTLVFGPQGDKNKGSPNTYIRSLMREKE